MQNTMRSTLKDVTKAANLITLPDVYLRLKSILDEPDFAMAEITLISAWQKTPNFQKI